MNFELGFGTGVQKVTVPDKNLLDVLTQNEVEVDLTGKAEVRRALQNPIGTPRLREIVKPGEKIAIVTSERRQSFILWCAQPIFRFAYFC